MQNDFINKTLEELENQCIPIPNRKNVTGLVHRILSLRKKPLKDYTTDDLRTSILQNEGLKYLIPIAIQLIEQDDFWVADEDIYYGALLKSVLLSDKTYWNDHLYHKEKVIYLFNNQLKQKILDHYEDDNDEDNKSYYDIKDQIFQAFENFLL